MNPNRLEKWTMGRVAGVWMCTVLAGLVVWPLVAASTPPVEIPVSESSNLFRWRPFLAPFHSVVLHFPIGFVTMAFILEAYRWWRPSPELKRITVLVLWLSLFSGIIAAVFGAMRAGSGGYEARQLELHRWFGISVPLFTLLTLSLQKLAFRQGDRPTASLGYRALLTATMALLLVAGHYGGNLTHGAKYLTENAPAFVKDLLEERPAEPVVAAGADAPGLTPGQQLFQEKIYPVLEAKCIRCHGPEKQKGEYRLDQREAALKGGESGKPAITPGDPMSSQLVRLIMLPRDHDDAMPPDGKEPLTPEEVMTVVQWIQQGAPFADTHPAATAAHSP